MPNENVVRAILRGTGQLEGEQYEEAMFEGYGPGGVGLLIQVVTTNRNRIVGEFRHLMSKNGGNMAEAGVVGWMFHRKGKLNVPKEAASEDKLLDLVLEAGAEDMKDDGSSWYIITPAESLETVKEALAKAGITSASAEVAMVPQKLRQTHRPTGSADACGSLKPSKNTMTFNTSTPALDIDESEIQAAVSASS